MNIYLAEITGIASRTDSRLQVRVIPDMNNIERDFLPIWPCFFQNHIITGDVGTLVWCVANEDFTTGYILGHANVTTETNDYSAASVPKSLFDTIDNVYVSLRGNLLNYRDIVISNYTEDSISFLQKKNSSHIIAFTNGTLHIVKPNEIYFHVGTSTLSIKDGEIAIEADNVRIGGTRVSLGDHPVGNIVVTDGGKTGAVSTRTANNVFA